jgi:hypothetical protein
MLSITNLIGALVADAYFATCILVFIFRLLGKAQISHAIGYLQMLIALPLAYLLFNAPALARPALYIVQAGLLLVFIVVETLLDYVLHVKFRKVRWAVISYVVLFFAATGGMLGVAAKAGPVWTLSAVALFLIMAALAFAQRAATGL